jgi:hypothetical protein
MNEQERNDLLGMLQSMIDDMPDNNDSLDGAVAIREDGTICVEGHDSLGNCAALTVTIADDDSYDVTLEGGFKEGTRFECNLFLGNIKDVVDAAVVIAQAAWDHCGIDKELVKGAIRQEWREPSETREFIIEQMIAHSAEME